MEEEEEEEKRDGNVNKASGEREGGRKGVDSFSSHSPSSSPPLFPPKKNLEGQICQRDRISRPLVIFLMVDDEACKCVPTKQGTKSNNFPQREKIGGLFAFSRKFFLQTAIIERLLLHVRPVSGPEPSP